MTWPPWRCAMRSGVKVSHSMAGNSEGIIMHKVSWGRMVNKFSFFIFNHFVFEYFFKCFSLSGVYQSWNKSECRLIQAKQGRRWSMENSQVSLISFISHYAQILITSLKWGSVIAFSHKTCTVYKQACIWTKTKTDMS